MAHTLKKTENIVILVFGCLETNMRALPYYIMPCYTSPCISCHEQYVNHFDGPLDTVIILTQKNITRVSIHKPLL